jgi:hypothetical protein
MVPFSQSGRKTHLPPYVAAHTFDAAERQNLCIKTRLGYGKFYPSG